MYQCNVMDGQWNEKTKISKYVIKPHKVHTFALKQIFKTISKYTNNYKLTKHVYIVAVYNFIQKQYFKLTIYTII